jgi:hypothetical protein
VRQILLLVIWLAPVLPTSSWGTLDRSRNEQDTTSPPPAVPSAFVAADGAEKRRMLYDIATSRSRLPIKEVIALVTLALQDTAVEVRTAALAAIAGRALVSRSAGTTGAAFGPAPDGRPPPASSGIPAEWRGDQARLNEALASACVARLREDGNAKVRHAALMALGNVQRPERPDEPFASAFVDLIAAVYRRDPDPAVRAEVVKTVRLMANNTVATREILRDGLVDPSDGVQHEALAAITPQAMAGTSKLSFDDAEPALAVAVRSQSPVVRIGAIRALNVFGKASAPYLPALERMEREDGDSAVREAARLAIAAINRDMGGSSGR